MAAKMQLNTLMGNMFVAGLLDDQFHQLQMVQKGSGLDFIDEVITLFCKEGRRNIGELAKILGKPCVDFNKVDDLLCKLNGSSATCLKMLDVVRNDFYDLHIKFQTMVQLEQQVRIFYPKK